MSEIVLKHITKAYDKNAPVISDLNLSIKEGSFTILLGPSGCGKSTILRMIAGLEEQTDGEIWIDGKNMENTQPGDRGIAMVFQNYALYPTMTVKENIEFGLKNCKIPREEREKRIQEVISMVGLYNVLDRKPNLLSGGQRQRVALARAMVKKPKVFLMDEPLSNLDAKLRAQLRLDLKELHRKLGTTFVYVTHDQIEAMSMGTEIILLDKGKVMQQATPLEVYNKPQSVFAAQFIGTPPTNVLKIEKSELDLKGPTSKYIGFRAEAAKLLEFNEEIPQDGLELQGNIRTHEILGTEVVYKLKTGIGELQVKELDNEHIKYGTVKIYIPSEKIMYFDESKLRIG